MQSVENQPTYGEAEFVRLWSCVVKQCQSMRTLRHVMVQRMSLARSLWQLRSLTLSQAQQKRISSKTRKKTSHQSLLICAITVKPGNVGYGIPERTLEMVCCTSSFLLLQLLCIFESQECHSLLCTRCIYLAWNASEVLLGTWLDPRRCWEDNSIL